ncbi:MAG: UDP-glucose 4-epimerase GalE [Erysipelotrichaceae bacterium]
MAILVTGGAGYIGSHTCVELLNEGFDIVIADNYYNSKPVVLDRIKSITNKDFPFYEVDVCDLEKVEKIFQENNIEAVIHFAGYKAVGESVAKPIMYYRNNIDSALTVLEVMKKHNCNNFVFSSSATVYGNPKSCPIKEDFPLSTTNPYGTTKLFIERILTDAAFANKDLSIALLRYFNPIGAHKSGLLGENPNDIPNNLMPYIAKVATKELEKLHVFGNDYDTKDGTGVRDYIHVVDLARGHVAAIKKILKSKGVKAYNLGTGVGYSVLEIVENFSKINNIEIPYVIDPRRPGDIAMCYADGTLAKEELGFTTLYNITDMCQDTYNFIMAETKRNRE